MLLTFTTWEEKAKAVVEPKVKNPTSLTIVVKHFVHKYYIFYLNVRTISHYTQEETASGGCSVMSLKHRVKYSHKTHFTQN